MISVLKATDDKGMDKKRGRFILKIGVVKIHITKEEAWLLYKSLRKLKLHELVKE